MQKLYLTVLQGKKNCFQIHRTGIQSVKEKTHPDIAKSILTRPNKKRQTSVS